jgi:hypothetical protein
MILPMPILAAAVVLVGLLCVVDLVLTFAVLRRLREHTDHLDRLSSAGGTWSGIDRERFVGRELPEFSTETVNGAGGVELVGFFLPNCSPCHAEAPLFVDEARALGPGRALALVAGSGGDADDLVRMFDGVAQVVRDPTSGELVRALNVGAFPTFLRLDSHGAIVDAAISIKELRTPTEVAGA